jgi:hypothetical protein
VSGKSRQKGTFAKNLKQITLNEKTDVISRKQQEGGRKETFSFQHKGHLCKRKVTKGAGED